MRRNVQAKSRPGAQRVGVKGSLASAPREELIISTLGEAGKDISPGWNSRPLDKQGERGEATLGVRVTSAAARSNGKMTKQAGHLHSSLHTARGAQAVPSKALVPARLGDSGWLPGREADALRSIMNSNQGREEVKIP